MVEKSASRLLSMVVQMTSTKEEIVVDMEVVVVVAIETAEDQDLETEDITTEEDVHGLVKDVLIVDLDPGLAAIEDHMIGIDQVPEVAQGPIVVDALAANLPTDIDVVHPVVPQDPLTERSHQEKKKTEEIIPDQEKIHR